MLKGYTLKTEHGQTSCTLFEASLSLRFHLLRSSPRPISTRKLNTSPYLHFEPINPVVFRGSYLFKTVGYLILRTASRLDAFSVYPIRT